MNFKSDNWLIDSPWSYDTRRRKYSFSIISVHVTRRVVAKTDLSFKAGNKQQPAYWLFF